MNVEDPVTRRPVSISRLIAAMCFALLGAMGIWEFFIEGEETGQVWFRLACIPGSIMVWMEAFHGTLASRLQLVLGFIVTVIIGVGLYRTEDWLLVIAAVTMVLCLGWLTWRRVRTRE